MSFSKWLLSDNKKLDRLKACFYALEIGTVVCSLTDKILTFFALIYWGEIELNPFARGLMNVIGVLPAVVVGFLASILPMLLIHYGIRRFKWNTEGHYWIFTLFMIFYFVIFYKLIESQLTRCLL